MASEKKVSGSNNRNENTRAIIKTGTWKRCQRPKQSNSFQSMQDKSYVVMLL